VRPRLEAADANLDLVDIHSDERPIMLPGDIKRLERSIREHKAKLVVLDPIAGHLTPSIHQDQEVRKALTPPAPAAGQDRMRSRGDSPHRQVPPP
jgi:hypothetical protein